MLATKAMNSQLYCLGHNKDNYCGKSLSYTAWSNRYIFNLLDRLGCAKNCIVNKWLANYRMFFSKIYGKFLMSNELKLGGWRFNHDCRDISETNYWSSREKNQITIHIQKKIYFFGEVVFSSINSAADVFMWFT